MHAQEPIFMARIFQYWKQALPKVKTDERKKESLQIRRLEEQLFLSMKEIIVMSISVCKTASYILFFTVQKNGFPINSIIWVRMLPDRNPLRMPWHTNAAVIRVDSSSRRENAETSINGVMLIEQRWLLRIH